MPLGRARALWRRGLSFGRVSSLRVIELPPRTAGGRSGGRDGGKDGGRGGPRSEIRAEASADAGV